MSLCEVCRDALQKWDIPTKYIPDDDSANRPHHLAVLGFLDAVDEKCYICWRAYRRLDLISQRLMQKLGTELKHVGDDGVAHTPPTKTRTFSTIWVYPKETSMGQVVSIHVNFWERYPETVAWKFKISNNSRQWGTFIGTDEVVALGRAMGAFTLSGFGIQLLCLDKDTSMPRIKHRLPNSPRTDSAETFELIEKWLQDCVTTHKSCKTPKGSEFWRPSRLLDIGTPHSGGSIASVACHLVDGLEALPGQSYVTISHRWGNDQVVKLTTENLIEFKDGIPLESLPKTFVDCISVARRLNIRYIWIDSICIIQSGDNGQDWLHEASQMHHVYANAFCNLMASWGTALGGIFYDRDMQVFDQIAVDLIMRSDGQITRKIFSSVESRIWNEEVSRSPLNHRAWVLQERLLSRRNLHFCQREVFWECSERACCETLPDVRFPPDVSIFDDESHLKTFKPRLVGHREGLIKRRGTNLPVLDINYVVWADIVKTYSKGKLTYASDKLVALSGVARYMKGILADTYVAGLWLRYLPGELLWWTNAESPWSIVKSDAKRPRNPAGGYRAPSFSWASTDNEVAAGEPHSLGIIVDVRCVKFRPSEAAGATDWKDEPVTEDIFGPISTPLVELKVVGRVVPARITVDEDNFLYVYPLGYTGNKHSEPLVSPSLDNPLHEPEKEKFLQEMYYYVPWRDDSQSTLPERGREITYLLLELADVKMARFRRIGIFMGEYIEQGDLYVKPWDHEHETESWQYMYDEVTGAHTIYII